MVSSSSLWSLLTLSMLPLSIERLDELVVSVQRENSLEKFFLKVRPVSSMPLQYK